MLKPAKTLCGFEALTAWMDLLPFPEILFLSCELQNALAMLTLHKTLISLDWLHIATSSGLH